MAVLNAFLAKSAYFSGLGEAENAAVSRFVLEKTAERGEIILFEGEPAEVLYFVVTGVVKVFKTSAEGKEQILELVRPGETFNDVPVFSGQTNLAGAEALGPVTLYGIKKSDLEAVFRDYPQFAGNIIKVLSEKVAHLVSLVEDLSFKNVTGRIAKILLEYGGDGQHPVTRLTQQEMAAIAGTAREMVGRSLKTLETDKAIRLERHRIVITDLKLLQGIAGVLA
ncbi:MAG: Crp/Fnr family transcriptional regulator [Chloroflexota bacterium]